VSQQLKVAGRVSHYIFYPFRYMQRATTVFESKLKTEKNLSKSKAYWETLHCLTRINFLPEFLQQFQPKWHHLEISAYERLQNPGKERKRM
jgi:hypothetical protein